MLVCKDDSHIYMPSFTPQIMQSTRNNSSPRPSADSTNNCFRSMIDDRKVSLDNVIVN